MTCGELYYRAGEFRRTRCTHPAKYKAEDKHGDIRITCGIHRNALRRSRPNRYTWTVL